MTREEEARTLRRIRELLPELSTDHQFAVVDGGETLLARPIPQAEHAPILTFCADCSWQDREFYIHAVDFVRLLLGLVDRAIEAHRRLAPPPRQAPNPKDYAAECAMKCAERGFQLYLQEVHGLEVLDEPHAAARVRSVLAIGSRADLNNDPATAAGWQRLRGDYDAWRKRG